MRPGFLDIDGGRIETAWWGPGPDDAPTVVLLHEGLGCVALWRDVPGLLAGATGCGVLAYSRFGYGQSDAAALPRPLDYMTREALTVLPQVLAAAGVRRAVLIGHSDGGSIAAIYAGAAGARLLGVVTIAAHFFVEDLTIASIEAAKAAYAGTDLRARLGRYHRDPDNAFRGWNDAWLDPGFRGFDITGFLPRIRVPALALQGEDDPYGTAEQLRVFGNLTGAETLLVPGARHAPHLEAPVPTLAAITGFIQRNLSP